MAKSGLRRKTSKLPVHLSLHERYEVAVYLINHERATLKSVGKRFNISHNYVASIRDEFLDKMWVWKKEVLESLLEAQGELFSQSGTPPPVK